MLPSRHTLFILYQMCNGLQDKFPSYFLARHRSLIFFAFDPGVKPLDVHVAYQGIKVLSIENNSISFPNLKSQVWRWLSNSLHFATNVCLYIFCPVNPLPKIQWFWWKFQIFFITWLQRKRNLEGIHVPSKLLTWRIIPVSNWLTS